MKSDFGRYIDHTLLRPIGTSTDIRRLCTEAMEYGMAAVCIFPSYVPMARDILKNSRVKIATVIAFPFGVTFTEIKEGEMRASAARGADEMDFVINIASLKSGDDKSVEEEMQYLTAKARTLGVTTKFIIETAYLTEDESKKPDPATAIVSTEARRLLSTLIVINHEITSILDLDELLKKIAELTNRIIPYEIFAIFLVDDEKQELYLRFAIGHPPELVKTLRIKVGDGVTGTAAMERTTVVVEAVRQYPRYIEAVKNARSELAVPLISRNRVVGVLDIESPEPGYFREDQVKLLNLLASQIAIAIENARVYESERRNRELLALLYDISLEMGSTLEIGELVHKIAAAVKQKINYHAFSIFLLDEKQGLLRPKFVIRLNEQENQKLVLPLGTGLVGAAAKMNEPLRIGDVTKDSRYLNVHTETRSEL